MTAADATHLWGPPEKPQAMAHHTERHGDMGIGLAIAMVIIAAIGGLAMVVGALDDLAAAGFAIAVVAGIIAVAAVHLYP